jgi:hypothetical protein
LSFGPLLLAVTFSPLFLAGEGGATRHEGNETCTNYFCYVWFLSYCVDPVDCVVTSSRLCWRRTTSGTMSNGWLDFCFSFVIYLLKLMATFHLGGIDLIFRTLSSVCFVFVFFVHPISQKFGSLVLWQC